MALRDGVGVSVEAKDGIQERWNQCIGGRGSKGFAEFGDGGKGAASEGGMVGWSEVEKSKGAG
jgi:hypothetical protein